MILAADIVPHGITISYLMTNYNSMNFLIKLFKPQHEKCKEHGREVHWVCYDQGCIKNRFICKDQRCNRKHSGHTLNRYEQYKEMLIPIRDHIQTRSALDNCLSSYKQNVVKEVEKLFEQMKLNLFSVINSKYCSQRFLEIEKLYKSQGDYIPLIYQHKEHFPHDIYKDIENLIYDKQKTVMKTIAKLEVSIDINAITNEKLEEYTFNQREIKIKSILPFKCDLKLRFKASENEFLSKKLHAVNIRGPIVLYVESHKGRHFGGYSSIMFPKYEEDYSLQYRDMHSFLFSIDHNQILPLKEEYKKYAIKGGVNFGFGQGDLLISDQCNKGNINWAEVGRTYKAPSNVKGPLNQWLGGASYFRVLEYEIYSVEGKKEK